METRSTGWRAVPAPLLLAFVVWIVWGLVRMTIQLGMTFEHGFSARLILAGEGVGLACGVLALTGTLELARRMTDRQAQGLKLAAAGIAIALAADLLVGFVQFAREPWAHRWVFDAYAYTGSLAWLLFPIGFTIAVRPERRVLGIVAIVVVFVSWPPPVVMKPLWGWLSLDGKSGFVFDTVLRMARHGVTLALTIAVARGVTTEDPRLAASGFRLAAKALWLRVIAALVVVMLTLMMIGARGGSGAVELFKLAMMAQGAVAVLALVMIGLGALRGARAAVPGLGADSLAIGGGGALWAAGVSLAQLPYLYGMLYRDGGGMWSRDEGIDWTEALSVAQPIVVILGVAVVATALSGFAARRGNEALRSDVLGKSIGFVALMIVALAIQFKMLPQSKSIGNFAVLSLLAAGAGLWATVMMARLFARGADALEAEPGLPTASLVSDGT